jgi:predicted DNA-binding transcriptional regulator AlpA
MKGKLFFVYVLRSAELRKIIPLSYTTIYEMEQREDFPKRFYFTPRCVVWDSDEVYVVWAIPVTAPTITTSSGGTRHTVSNTKPMSATPKSPRV